MVARATCLDAWRGVRALIYLGPISDANVGDIDRKRVVGDVVSACALSATWNPHRQLEQRAKNGPEAITSSNLAN